MQKLYFFLHFTYHIYLIIFLLYQSYLFTNEISDLFEILEIVFEVNLIIELNNSTLLKNYIVENRDNRLKSSL
jgi:hypothetical protein